MGKTRRRKGNNVVIAPACTQHLGAVRQKLAGLLRIATDLHNICGNLQIAELCDPPTWIMRQTELRAYWAELRPLLRTPEYDNERTRHFYNYMEFMYTSYPAGFGDKIKEFHAADVGFDGAAIYDYLNF
jgi:hypothetical protein